MTMRFFCVLLLGLGLAKLPAAELKVSKQIDVWPGEVPGEKRDIPPESTTLREYRGGIHPDIKQRLQADVNGLQA